MVDLERVEQDLGDAIGEVLRRHGLMVNRWVLVAEVLNEHGQRELVCFTSTDLRSWDSLGMLGYVLERERGAVHVDVADGGG